MQTEEFFKTIPEQAAPFWDGDKESRLVCCAVREETHDVKSFFFKPKTPSLFHFQPGQFLTFDFSIGGVTVNRCYTISSTPTKPYLVSITVKRVQGGMVSNWLHDTMRPGDEVVATAPLGEFSFAQARAEKYLLLSGGSGITPMMSMTRAQFDLAANADIVFMHHARTPRDIIFQTELEMIARSSTKFRFVPVCEADAPLMFWGGYRGRISAEMLNVAVPDFREREIFVCGPPPYMRAVKAMLQQLNFDMAHHHEESFDFAEEEFKKPLLAAEAAPAVPAASFKANFSKSGQEVDCPVDMTLLEAARTGGMRLPASCRKGLCGTCKSKLVSGKVDMTHQGGIRQREIDQGLILLCCSRPLTDVVIER